MVVKIITDCSQYLKPVDVSGMVFEYGGEKTYGTHPLAGYHVAVKPEDVQHTLESLATRIPLHWLQIPIFLIPLELQMWSKGWTGQTYRARVYTTHMVVGVQRPCHGYQETAALLCHELGHVFCFATTGHSFDNGEQQAYKEYKKLRGVDNWKDTAPLWELRPNELFAEDFRFLFGDEDMRAGDKFLHWQYVRPPGDDVRAFMLQLLERVPAPEEGKEEPKVTRICLDPGHGGSDPGAVGPSGVREKDITLAVAQQAAEHLRRHSVRVVLTRERDEDVSLAERCRIANEFGADLFLSVHCNSADSAAAHGTETWYMSAAGEKLATKVQAELVAALGRADRGVKKGNLYVLRNTRAPAALMEMAFVNNPEEEKLLTSGDFRERAAQGLAKGILACSGTPWQEPPAAPESPAPAGKSVLKIKVGGRQISRNDGKVFALDVPVRVEQGYTLVPLRAIAEALGCFVHYDAASKEITITKEE